MTKKKYLKPVALLIFGIAFCSVSAYISINTEGDWFARSGAILSFVSVVIQFLLSNIKKAELGNLFHSNIGLKAKISTLRTKNVRHETLSIASGITGLVGTLIWGYGGLLY